MIQQTQISITVALVLVVLIVFVLLILAVIKNISYLAVFRPSAYKDSCESDDVSKLYVDEYNTTTTYPPSLGKYINVWHYKFKSKSNKCLLACNTNTGNISCRKDLIGLCQAMGCDAILFDYFGYGKSYNSLSLQGLMESGEMAYSYARSLYPPTDIVVLGQSIGGAVATYLASKHACNHLVIFSSFYSLGDVIDYKTGSNAARMAVEAMLGDLPSYEWASKVTCPVTQLHSLTDGLISYNDAKRLFDCFDSDDKKFLTIRGTHSRPLIDMDVISKVVERLRLHIVNRKGLENVLQSLPTVVDGCK